MVGLFAEPDFFLAKASTASGFKAGLFHDGGWSLFGEQALANGVTIVYSFVVTALIMLALKHTIGVRVSPDVEASGLDLAEHAETAYHSGASSVLDRA
jgi:Amt family ammonium transporter